MDPEDSLRKEKRRKHRQSRSPSQNKKKKKYRDNGEDRYRKRSDSDIKKKYERSRQRNKDKKTKKIKSRSKEVNRNTGAAKFEDKLTNGDRYREQRSTREGKYVEKQRSRERYDRSRDVRYIENIQRRGSPQKDKWRRDDRNNQRGGWKRDYRERDRFRFDSPPKSDESDMSEDPEKMDKLNRMKAAKELVTSKADRKLYLGNLPPNITSTQLMEMLNSALKKMEINCEVEGDSIVSAWISPDGVGHYAFVEFRTAQEATNGLTLNGASLYGYQLKLGRPKQYIEYNKQLLSEYGSDGNIDTILKKVRAMGNFEESGLRVEEKIICPPSRVLVLKHVVTIQELAIDEEYTEILEDVSDMAKRFGDVLQIVIPRPHQVIDLEEVQKRVKGLGYIFIKYKTADQAKYARKEFIKLNFSQRSVACSYFPEQKLDAGEYDINEKVIIDF